jgi:hypothetical protein
LEHDRGSKRYTTYNLHQVSTVNPPKRFYIYSPFGACYIYSMPYIFYLKNMSYNAREVIRGAGQHSDVNVAS